MSGMSFLQGSFRYRKVPDLVYYNETDDLLFHGQTTLLCHLPSRLLASMGFSLFSRSRESSAVKQVFLFPRTSVKQSYNLHRSNRRMRSQDPDRSLCPEFPSFPVHKNRLCERLRIIRKAQRPGHTDTPFQQRKDTGLQPGDHRYRRGNGYIFAAHR